MENGWVKAPRDITDSWIWNDGVKFCKFKAFMDLMYSANYKEQETVINGEIKKIMPGSFLTSVLKLSQRWGWDRKRVSRFLKMLSDSGYIACERLGGGTMITVKKLDNSAPFSFFDQKNAQRKHHSEEQSEPQCDVHKKRNECTTNKEYNNIKKEYKNNSKKEEAEEEETLCACEQKQEYAKAVLLTKSEHALLASRYGREDTDKAIEILSDYKLATKKEYESDFYAITKWVIRAVGERKNSVISGSGVPLAYRASPPESEYELLKTTESAEEFEKRMWRKLNGIAT